MEVAKLRQSKRKKAEKRVVLAEYGINYCNIVRGKTVLAEFVRENHADRLIDGYNFLNASEIEEENKQRELETKGNNPLIKIAIPVMPTVTVKVERITKPKISRLNQYGFEVVPSKQES